MNYHRETIRPSKKLQKQDGLEYVGWECPLYMFDGAIYPPLLSGAGYVMPIQTLPCLFTEGLLYLD